MFNLSMEQSRHETMTEPSTFHYNQLFLERASLLLKMCDGVALAH